MTALLALLTNPKHILIWLAVLREAVQLARLVGPEKARDTIQKECSNCSINSRGSDGKRSRNKRSNRSSGGLV